MENQIMKTHDKKFDKITQTEHENKILTETEWNNDYEWNQDDDDEWIQWNEYISSMK